MALRWTIAIGWVPPVFTWPVKGRRRIWSPSCWREAQTSPPSTRTAELRSCLPRNAMTLPCWTFC
eukprot:7451-Eustigmatos_ZCMA.PRE.1